MTTKNTHDFVYECEHCDRSPWEFRKRVRQLLRGWAVRNSPLYGKNSVQAYCVLVHNFKEFYHVNWPEYFRNNHDA